MLGPVLFIIGDIIGAGIFAVTGKVTAEVGGFAWLPFLLAFAIATLAARRRCSPRWGSARCHTCWSRSR